MKKLIILFAILALVFTPIAIARMSLPLAVSVVPAVGGISVSYRSYSSDGTENGADCVLTKPSGTASSDLLITFLVIDSTTPDITTPPTGFAEVDDTTEGGTLRGHTYWKEAGGSEPASYTWTYSGSDNAVCHMIAVQKTGGSWTDPTTANYHSIVGSGGTNTTITTTSVTANTGDTLLVYFSHDGIGTPKITCKSVAIYIYPAASRMGNFSHSSGKRIKFVIGDFQTIRTSII